MKYNDILSNYNINNLTDGDLDVHTPIDGSLIATVKQDTQSEVIKKISLAKNAFQSWRKVPAPRRGELIRLLGEELRKDKENLAKLVTLECGKIYQEGLGEVQEMIDICDFAVGLSRQLYGKTIVSERPLHHMREYWQPVGTCGVISAFNFPVAVWAWNATLAIVCGNPVIWKPSEKTPLTAIACQQIFENAMKKFGDAPQGLQQIIIGNRDIGEILVDSKDVPIISATGSTAMGRIVGQKVASKFGKSILELGGNNAMIVAPSADLEMAKRAILFSAVGTAGQRCTSLRRLIVHEDIYAKLISSLKSAYSSIKIGNPLDETNLIGPLIDKDSFNQFEQSIKKSVENGGIVHEGERSHQDGFSGGYYANPCIIEMNEQIDIVKHETFAPILYVMKYKDLEDAIHTQNDVPQGLSSCIFTNDIKEAELFISTSGSDCGIANVNIGPSGAEIGGAFGGEKETGGGRESGSDAWQSYMRRQTSTVNYSSELPLAQGIKFDIE